MDGESQSHDPLGASVEPVKASPRRIAVLTSGGDAPGMNAAIRAVVRAAEEAGIEVLGVQRGYEGLIYGNFNPLPSRAVANIIQRGGTILETSRSPKFHSTEGRVRAAESLHYRGAEALVVIGGDGTLSGATAFAQESNINLMFLPASIDNDIPGTDFSIGFDTAVNTALEAIDRIRDTAFAHERLFFIEVMGRDSGFIALWVAVGGGAEAVVLPEIKFDIDVLCRTIVESQQRGKRSSLIVVSEGPTTGGAIAIAEAVKKRVGMEARLVVLGHIQRGGAPTARDRILASRLGTSAVKAIVERRPPSLVGEDRGEIALVPLGEVSGKKRQLDPNLIAMVSTLSL